MQPGCRPPGRSAGERAGDRRLVRRTGQRRKGRKPGRGKNGGATAPGRGRTAARAPVGDRGGGSIAAVRGDHRRLRLFRPQWKQAGEAAAIAGGQLISQRDLATPSFRYGRGGNLDIRRIIEKNARTYSADHTDPGSP